MKMAALSVTISRSAPHLQMMSWKIQFAEEVFFFFEDFAPGPGILVQLTVGGTE
jgi:hypothetical protein